VALTPLPHQIAGAEFLAARPKRKMIGAEFVRSILDYDSLTGVFRWKTRSPDSFDVTAVFTLDHVANKWNSEFAGTIAGHVNKSGYRIIKINGSAFKAGRLARLIMTGEMPPDQVDHRDLIRSNDKFDNLRPANTFQNTANRRALRNNQSGIKGIWLHTYRGVPTGQWRASIKRGKKQVHLGLFRCPAAAHVAYVIAADEQYGEFARTS
jgi:hypothetical protein